MYNKIYNPIINKFVDINSSSGKKLLVNYLNQSGAGKYLGTQKNPTCYLLYHDIQHLQQT
jgi:hypothetical protein